MSDSAVTAKPNWSTEQAQRVAATHFGFSGTARELPSERDQNFRVEGDDGRRAVLKVANPAEARTLLELQNLVLSALSQGTLSIETPRILLTTGGDEILSIEDPTGQSPTPLLVRLISWLEGEPLARVRPHDGDLLRRLGGAFGELSRLLAPIQHAAAKRPFQWDLQSGLDLLERHPPDRAGGDHEALLRRLQPYLDPIPRLAGRLPVQLIHGDGNDYNIIVERRRGEVDRLGLIDFGDMIQSWRVAELAILLAYAMLGKRDPLAAAEPIIAGFHAKQPLQEDELEVLLPLVLLRLMTSVTLAAYQRKLMPGNEYLSVTEQPAWELLEQLSQLHPNLGHCCLRRAAGLEPHPRSAALQRWILDHGEASQPLVQPDPMALPNPTTRPPMIIIGVETWTVMAGMPPATRA